MKEQKVAIIMYCEKDKLDIKEVIVLTITDYDGIGNEDNYEYVKWWLVNEYGANIKIPIEDQFFFDMIEVDYKPVMDVMQYNVDDLH